MIGGLWLIPACLAAGGLIGFSGGVLGIGGGLFAIPLLGLVLGYDQQAAQGTALIMVLPAILLTVRKYHQHAPVDLRASAVGAAGSILFTWFGAQLALGVDSLLLRRAYAGFVFLVALFYFRESLGRRARGRPPAFYRDVANVSRRWVFLIGALAGLAGGVFGVGGAVVAVPFLTGLFHVRQTSAQALALAMVAPGHCVALATYAWHGQAHGLVGVPLAIGSLLCVPYGVRLAYALPEARLKLIFACLLLVIMGLLLMKGGTAL